MRTLRTRSGYFTYMDVMKSQSKKGTKKAKKQSTKDVGPLCPTFDKEEWENDFVSFPEEIASIDHIDALLTKQESEQFQYISEECECEVEEELTENILCRQDEIRRIIGLIGRVLDKCERLRDLSKTILPAFNRLKQLTGLNVCVIFLSNIIPEKFHSAKGYFETIPVHFKQYTKDEIFQILSVNHPWPEKDSLYKNYLKLFLGVFYGSCRDLCELKYMVIFPHHMVEKAMYRNTCREHEKTEYENDFTLASNTAVSKGRGNHDQLSSQEFALSFELPYYSKYFLIAAYLASYIPSKLDKALFMKRKDKKKKKRVNRSKNDILSDMLLGPKPFTVDRLLAIFYSIVQDEVSFTVNLSVQKILQFVCLSLEITYNAQILFIELSGKKICESLN
uniref:Orc5 n=1 Tax=Locusta migratoria TaxID=7004 RepID=A0A6M8NP24_LOCMI|nr:Orc5 [Locusta migratoria]